MRIVVTDTGLIWNHKNPMLKKCKNAVMVVCLNGKKVTDEYECFVSPYKSDENDLEIGTSSEKYLALESVADVFNGSMHYHDDIIFMTDENPETLYPFFAIKDRSQYNNLHLCAMSPWRFETEERIGVHKFLLSDLCSLRSFLYIDSNAMVNGSEKTDFFNDMYSYYTSLLPMIVTEISYLKYNENYFFDFATMRYVSVDKGFNDVDINNINDKSYKLKNDITPSEWLCGLVPFPDYCNDSGNIKKSVESPSVRLDGKQICDLLREKRILLAEMNNIPFESEPCPSTGPCGGTCEKCDKEGEYLAKKLSEIPETKRVYPYFNVEERKI